MTAPASAAVVGGSRDVAPVMALFQRRIPGDDALLRLARRRFMEAGLGAEVYAHVPDDLQRILEFVPPGGHLPMVHLDRKLDLSAKHDRDVVLGFADRFAGRVSGLVVHDQRAMPTHADGLVQGVGELDEYLGRSPGRPHVFLEYAAGHPLDWFVDLGQRLSHLRLVSIGIDTGHIGIRHARRRFEERHPGLELTSLTAADERLPALVADVDDAVASALPILLELIRTLGAIGKPLHFHLHDGHPLVIGLQDHRSFLMHLPIPFEHNGRCSLSPLYGPGGLAAIVTTAVEACPEIAPSLTLEIHEADGRLPVADGDLFRDWSDLANAERMNHWLGILADNGTLVTAALERR